MLIDALASLAISGSAAAAGGILPSHGRLSPAGVPQPGDVFPLRRPIYRPAIPLAVKKQERAPLSCFSLQCRGAAYLVHAPALPLKGFQQQHLPDLHLHGREGGPPDVPGPDAPARGSPRPRPTRYPQIAPRPPPSAKWARHPGGPPPPPLPRQHPPSRPERPASGAASPAGESCPGPGGAAPPGPPAGLPPPPGRAGSP